MTKQHALSIAIKESESSSSLYSSAEIAVRAKEIYEASFLLNKRMNEYNSLSDKRVKTQANGKESVYSVIRVMNSSTCAEFLGEEFWMSLTSVEQKILVNRVYNSIRAKLTSKI